jgi:hypothetical protein
MLAGFDDAMPDIFSPQITIVVLWERASSDSFQQPFAFMHDGAT